MTFFVPMAIAAVDALLDNARAGAIASTTIVAAADANAAVRAAPGCPETVTIVPVSAIAAAAICSEIRDPWRASDVIRHRRADENGRGTAGTMLRHVLPPLDCCCGAGTASPYTPRCPPARVAGNPSPRPRRGGVGAVGVHDPAGRSGRHPSRGAGVRGPR